MEIPVKILELFHLNHYSKIELLIAKKHIAVYKVITPDRVMLLKKWMGHNKINRLINEMKVIDKLRRHGFQKMAYPSLSTENKMWEYESDELLVGWSAYDFVDNHYYNYTINKAKGEIVGRLIAELHSKPIHAETINKSRIHELKEQDAMLRAYGFGECLDNYIYPYIDCLLILPYATIHGDINQSNILWKTEEEALFIDFEFSRSDIRMFDLASILGPQFLEDGSYETLNIEFAQGVIEGYQTYNIRPLSSTELQQLPRVQVIYWLLILIDSQKSNGVQISIVIEILKKLVERIDEKNEVLFSNIKISRSRNE